MSVKVSLDGGETFVDAPNGVRVIYDSVDVPGEDDGGELHVNLTHEGIITDVWVTRLSALDHNIATESKTVDEILDQLIEEQA